MRMYARVDGNVVQEIIETDGDIETMFHPSLIWIDCTDEPECSFGWLYDGAVFSPPPPVQPSLEELRQEALRMRDDLMAAANEATVGMADAYVAGLLSAEEVTRFKAYAAYKLALGRITTQPGFPESVSWPDIPQA